MIPEVASIRAGIISERDILSIGSDTVYRPCTATGAKRFSRR